MGDERATVNGQERWEQLAVTATGPLVQARNHAVRGPVIDAIRAGRVRTLAQVVAALEEWGRRERGTERECPDT
jgi:hypothetical protein